MPNVHSAGGRVTNGESPREYMLALCGCLPSDIFPATFPTPLPAPIPTPRVWDVVLSGVLNAAVMRALRLRL